MARSGHPALVLLLVAAILLNIVQFRAIDLGTVDFFDAINRNDTADILEIGYRECAWCRDRYGIHLGLRVVAPRAGVIVPTDSHQGADRYTAEEFELRLFALGKVASVNWVPFDPSSILSPDGALDPTPFIIASGPGGEKGAPWAIAVDPARLPSGDRPDADDYLRTALADGQHHDLRGPPRDFVILRWEQAREGSDYTYQDLALEVSLLPAAVREELAR